MCFLSTYFLSTYQIIWITFVNKDIIVPIALCVPRTLKCIFTILFCRKFSGYIIFYLPVNTDRPFNAFLVFLATSVSFVA